MRLSNNELRQPFEAWAGQPATHVIQAPYRINPLGAHVDHQGGAVLGRSIDLGTTLVLHPIREPEVTLSCYQAAWSPSVETVSWRTPQPSAGWPRYAHAAVSVLQSRFCRHITAGFKGMVHGSLPGAGLSSSASVVLAYLVGLAAVNNITLTPSELVELVRQVENEQLGLNNGVQDQTSIVYGRRQSLTYIDNLNRTTTSIPDPVNQDGVCWLLTYSGFSRELLGSGFNNRVAECRTAAQQLHPTAEMLCHVPSEKRTEDHLSALPDPLGRRARHFFSEIERVEAGSEAWADGDWAAFGRLMNRSCHSSITQYESGSQPLVDLHEIVSAQSGVYGSRFCGGGYGGCLLALVDKTAVSHLIPAIETAYLQKYPEKEGVAQAFVVNAVDSIEQTRIPA